MSDDDLIRRGDALAEVEFYRKDWVDARDALAALPARGVGVKPLMWQPTYDGAGNLHRVTVAYCPVFEKRFYAERPEDQPRIEAKRAARILAALEPALAAQAREAALREAAAVVKRLAIKDYTENQSSKWERNAVLEASDAILALTGKPCVGKSWDELSDEEIYETMNVIQQEIKSPREAALIEAVNVCKVFQSNARTNDAWLHACEIEEAILALIGEART